MGEKHTSDGFCWQNDGLDAVQPWHFSDVFCQIRQLIFKEAKVSVREERDQ